MAADGKEYGVDWAQDEVPPHELFSLEYTCTGGRIGEREVFLDTPIYTAYGYANIAAHENEKMKYEERYGG